MSGIRNDTENDKRKAEIDLIKSNIKVIEELDPKFLTQDEKQSRLKRCLDKLDELLFGTNKMVVGGISDGIIHYDQNNNNSSSNRNSGGGGGFTNEVIKDGDFADLSDDLLSIGDEK